MDERGFAAMMVGYATNHGAGTYRLFNPKTNRIIMSRDVSWMDFKSKQIEDEFKIFEPGIKSEVSSDIIQDYENDENDNSSISQRKVMIQK